MPPPNKDAPVQGEVILNEEEQLTRALIRAQPGDAFETSLAASLSRAEIDVQIQTAKAHPRSMALSVRQIQELATQDTETATECMYSLSRDGKAITGPSIRFAELCYAMWGNCRLVTRISEVNREEGYVEAEVVYHDLEKNAAKGAVARRSIKNKHGRLYSADMILMTQSAAISIATRNAILSGIPKPIWRFAYEKAKAVIRGDEKTLNARRANLLVKFKDLGVEPATVFKLASVKGAQDVGLEELVVLAGFYSALQNQETTVGDLLGRVAPSATQVRTLDAAFGEPAATPHDPQTGEVIEGQAGEQQADPPSTTTPQSEVTDAKPQTTTTASSTATSSAAETPAEPSNKAEPAEQFTVPVETSHTGAEVDLGDGLIQAGKAETPTQWPVAIHGSASDPDETYHLSGDLADDKGMVKTYRDGKPYSRSGVKAGHRIYTHHPGDEDAAEQAEPASAAAEADAEKAERLAQADRAAEDDVPAAGELDVEALNAFVAKVQRAEFFDTIHSELTKFRKTEDYKDADGDTKRRTQLVAYNAAVALRDAGKDNPQPDADPRFYELWLLAAEPAEVRPMFAKLIRSKAYLAASDGIKDFLARITDAAEA